MMAEGLRERRSGQLGWLALIAVLVVAASWTNVSGLQALMGDDNGRYHDFIHQQFSTDFARRFIGLLGLSKWFHTWLLVNFSAEAARLFVLLAYMVPTSGLFYLFNRRFMGLGHWAALTVAVLVNAMPQQYAIPAFLDGSYPTLGMLAFMATLWLAARYLEAPGRARAAWAGAALAWLLACDLMMELGLFLAPALLYFIHSARAGARRRLALLATVLLIAAARVVTLLTTVGENPTNRPVLQSLEEVSRRVFQSLEWWLPLNEPSPLLTALVVAAVALGALRLHSRARGAPGAGRRNDRIVVFYTTWFLVSSAPFWLITPFFTARYFYVPHMGLTALAVLVLFRMVPARHWLAPALSLLLIGAWAWQRNVIQADEFERRNLETAEITRVLGMVAMGDDAQLALVNFEQRTGGFHSWSSGHLAWVLGRPGVTGIIGPERNFYDPFNPGHCAFTHPMSCLDPEGELLAWRRDEQWRTQRMSHFLQWFSEGEADSRWRLLRAGGDRHLRVVDEGAGMDEYRAALERLELESDHVLWGRLP